MNGTSDRALGRRIVFRPEHIALTATVLASLPALFEAGPETCGMMVTVISIIALSCGAATGRPVYGEPIALLGIVWFLAAGLPLLAPGLYGTDWYRERVSSRFLDLSALWLYRSWAAIAIGYWAARTVPRRRAPPDLTGRADQRERTFEKLVGIFGLVGIVGTIALGRGEVSVFTESTVQKSGTVGQIVSYFRTCGYIYLFLVAARYGWATRKITKDTLALGNLCGLMAIGAISGAKAGIFAPLVALALGFALRARAKPTPIKDLALTASGFAVAYAASVAVTAYRILLRATPPPTSDNVFLVIWYQVSLFFEGIYLSLTGGVDASPALLTRFSHVTGLALVFNASSAESPHQGAVATFLTPIYALVPRDWLPIKEVFFNSGQMAGLMGLTFGGLSITLPGSIYWALGYTGIPIACFCIGWVVAKVHQGAEFGALRSIARFVFLPLMLILLDVGAEFHSTIIDSIRFLCFAVFLMWIAHSWTAPRASPDFARQFNRRPR